MIDRFYSYSLLLIAAAATALIVADIKGYFSIVQDPIASLKQTTGTVKRLPKDELGWDQAAKGTKFAEGDAISVGENGTATLEFKNGSTVELSEGSLMVLSSNAEKVELSFAAGRAKLRLIKAEQEKLFKISQASTITPPPQQKTAETTAVENLKPVVVEMVTAQKIVKEFKAPVAKPKKSSFGGQGEIISRTLAPRAPTPRLPETGTTIYTTEKTIVEFAWDKVNTGTPAAQYEFILTSSDGNTIVRESETANLKVGSIPDGQYTWTVRAIDAQGNKSTVSTSQTLQLKTAAKTQAPKLLAPTTRKLVVLKAAVVVPQVKRVPASVVATKPATTAATKPVLLAPSQKTILAPQKPILLAPKPVLLAPKVVTSK
jgi:predicted phage tail protein